MKCYKGFNADLTCTKGHGRFQYEVGSTFTAESAKCAASGLHCVEEPLDVLTWYNDKGSRYCIVEAAGDINEADGKICCTEMTLIKEVTREHLGILECMWIQKHPERETCKWVYRDSHTGIPGEEVIVVRGKNPIASGCTGATIFLLKEKPRTKEIECCAVYKIDGNTRKANIRYNIEGRKAVCKKRSSGSFAAYPRLRQL